MNKLFALAGAALFPASSVLAAPFQPTHIQNVFYQAAWEEYAEGVAMDLQDPSITQTKADDFRIKMYKSINEGLKSFKYEYFHVTQDNSDCLNTQVTAYDGAFSIKHPETNFVSVNLETVTVYVVTMEAEGCTPKL